MTGKFNNSSNIVFKSYCFIIFPLILIGVAIITAENGHNIAIGVFLVVILVLVSILLLSLLKKCEFSADDEKIVFRVVFPFLKYTYYFSEIKSASTQVGFSHGRYGASARVELVITLSDGECITFYDEDVPDEALSNPENHKMFQDTHQFTALCRYINERAGK
jgi:hypothetical protein|nr:MAG TPA: EbsA-like protein [Caudoviricetes sp.]